MPIYTEISPLHRLVTIVARGKLTSDEIHAAVQRLADARVRRYAKIAEIAGAFLDLSPRELPRLAEILRSDPDGRGPIALVVGPGRGMLARQFATLTEREGPIAVFHKLHDARAWIAELQEATLWKEDGLPATPSESSHWSEGRFVPCPHVQNSVRPGIGDTQGQ